MRDHVTNRHVLKITPSVVKYGNVIIIRGTEFGNKHLELEIDSKKLKPTRCILGSRTSSGFLADDGNFVLMVSTYQLEPGTHKVTVSSKDKDKHQAFGTFKIMAAQKKEKKFGFEGENKQRRRALAFFNARFGRIGYVPDGLRK